MHINEYQEQIVAIVNRYGRPDTLDEHIDKLKEEYQELLSETEKGPVDYNKVAAEIADVINVCTLTLDYMCGNLETELNKKMEILKERMRAGRFDQKYGPKDPKLVDLQDSVLKFLEFAAFTPPWSSNASTWGDQCKQLNQALLKSKES